MFDSTTCNRSTNFSLYFFQNAMHPHTSRIKKETHERILHVPLTNAVIHKQPFCIVSHVTQIAPYNTKKKIPAKAIRWGSVILTLKKTLSQLTTVCMHLSFLHKIGRAFNSFQRPFEYINDLRHILTILKILSSRSQLYFQ